MDEDGGKRPGFGSSECRLCLGGKVWRRWDPVASSKQHGTDYESWEWAGPAALGYAMKLRGVGRPSRVDVAWDFEVLDETTAEVFFQRVCRFARSRRLTIGVSGEEPHVTRYVGSKQSERRLRIYRKDVQQGKLWAAQDLPPVLRLELVLKDRAAADFWAVWADDPEAAYAMAAGQVEAMIGVPPQDGRVEWSTFERPEPFDAAQQVLAFMEQYGPQLVTWMAAGVPVLELAKECPRSTDRRTEWRRRKRLEALQRVGPELVVRAVRSVWAASAGP